MSPEDLIDNINEFIVNPLILLLMATATVYFLWGLSMFLANAEDTTERSEGKRKIVYGLIGLFIMVSVFGIINLVLGTFGVGSVGF